ncbi:MAG: hypothetical protein LBO77_06615, partial [Desulfovibrio sp.]|nr:hypothetical protein [Desulfovibrio sp.]
TSDLDIDTAREILELLLNMNKNGVGFLVATHDAELSRCGGLILEMRSGRLAGADSSKPPGRGFELEME